jgi:hypothetical protein
MWSSIFDVFLFSISFSIASIASFLERILNDFL